MRSLAVLRPRTCCSSYNSCKAPNVGHLRSSWTGRVEPTRLLLPGSQSWHGGSERLGVTASAHGGLEEGAQCIGASGSEQISAHGGGSGNVEQSSAHGGGSGNVEQLHKLRLVISCEVAVQQASTDRHEPRHGSPPPGEGPQAPGAQRGPGKQLRAMHGDRYIRKELRSLVKQIEMSMSTNRRAGSPFEIHVTSWLPGSDLDVFGQWTRVETWPVARHQEALHEVFPLQEVVMLSPDAEVPLTQLDPDKVYCVGGVVDRSVRKGLSLGFADRHGITARRLPIQEHAEALGMCAGSSRSPILNVSDVVVALVNFRCSGDWVAALKDAIPERKKRAT